MDDDSSFPVFFVVLKIMNHNRKMNISFGITGILEDLCLKISLKLQYVVKMLVFPK